MTANDDTPSTGKEPAESIDQNDRWAEIGQLLAQAELERLGTDIAVTFRQTASKVARGEEIEESDVRVLYSQLEEARVFIDEFAAVVPGSRQGTLAEHMTSEELQRVTERVKEEIDADR
jgi:hypothetical protein